MILLAYRVIYSIILGKYTQKMMDKNTKPVYWITQGVEFKTSYTIKVETVLPELYATEIVTWNYYVYDS